jgi:hypothetical protein
VPRRDPVLPGKLRRGDMPAMGLPGRPIQETVPSREAISAPTLDAADAPHDNRAMAW